jgi:hypothetical protein
MGRFRQAMQALPLTARLVLAIASGCSYGVLGLLAERSDAFDAVLTRANTAWHIIAIVFGALVMAPYAAASRLALARALAMCLASIAIYYGAVRFVVDGPFGYDSMAPFLIAGGGAALLVGVAVLLLSSRPFQRPLIPATLAAGAIGGAAFDVNFGLDADLNLAVAHVAWQALVCVALYLGFRDAKR